MRLFLILILLIPFAVNAELEKDKFNTIASSDFKAMNDRCQAFAFDQNKIDITELRMAQQGFVVSRSQIQVVLYTACMAKAYDRNLQYMLQRLPTGKS